uniref:Uncharacterized protein n=1 Tax=Sinocyclocheilus anshuiensis TaxID=1608454 RepID=A0A671PN83_9TELE
MTEPTISTSGGSSMACGMASLFSDSMDTEKQSAARNTALASAPTTSARPMPMSDSMLNESDTSAMELPMYPATISATKKMTRPMIACVQLGWRCAELSVTSPVGLTSPIMSWHFLHALMSRFRSPVTPARILHTRNSARLRRLLAGFFSLSPLDTHAAGFFC